MLACRSVELRLRCRSASVASRPLVSTPIAHPTARAPHGRAGHQRGAGTWREGAHHAVGSVPGASRRHPGDQRGRRRQRQRR
eukprot:9424859-Pyramimonas_sp.AAC.2